MGGARHADIRTCPDGVSNAHVWSKREIKMDEARRAREQARNDMTSPQTFGCHRQGQGGGGQGARQQSRRGASRASGRCVCRQQAGKAHCECVQQAALCYARSGCETVTAASPAGPIPSHPIGSNPDQRRDRRGPRTSMQGGPSGSGRRGEGACAWNASEPGGERGWRPTGVAGEHAGRLRWMAG